MIGTLGIRTAIGAKEHIASSGYTTPRAPQLQKILAQMLTQKITHVAIEASSEGLALGRLYGTHLYAAGFSGLGRDHLDFHKDIQKYFAAKKILFSELACPSQAHVVIAMRDHHARLLAKELKDYPKRTDIKKTIA